MDTIIGYLDGVPIYSCKGCGYCCSKAQCGVSYAFFGQHKLCPALYWNGDRYVCKLVTESLGIVQERFKVMLHIGAGCSSTLFNSWRDEVKPRHGEINTCL